MKRLNNQSGFTLIELVVVIVILGILAATAAPKFIDLQDDASSAVLEGVEAALKSSSTLVHSKSLIEGNQDTAPAAGVDVSVNGVDVLIAYGYPRSNAGAAAAWGNLIDIDTSATGDFVISDTAVAGSIVIYPIGKTAPTALTDSCIAFFTEATGAADVPDINSVAC